MQAFIVEHPVYDNDDVERMLSEFSLSVNVIMQQVEFKKFGQQPTKLVEEEIARMRLNKSETKSVFYRLRKNILNA